MAASCISMATTQVLPSLEAAAATTLGGGSPCLKGSCSRLPMMALPKSVPCHSGISHARHAISCLTPVLGRRRLLRITALAQDSPLAAQVVDEEQDIPVGQAEKEEEEAPPATGFSEGEESEERLGGIQAVQEEDSDVATGSESKGEQGSSEDQEDQDLPPLPEGTKLYVGNIPFDVDSESLAKLFDESGVVEMVEVIYDRSSGRSRGFAFVTMRTVEEAEAAIKKFDGFEIGGRSLRVNFPAVPRVQNGRSQVRSPNFGAFVDSPHKLYVGNLAWSVTSEALREVFNRKGNVLGARVIQDRETGRSRGFGFVSFSSEAEVEASLSEMDGLELEGRSIRVNVAKPRSAEGQSY